MHNSYILPSFSSLSYLLFRKFGKIIDILKKEIYNGNIKFRYFDFLLRSDTMYSSEVTIKREEGLHARPATFFIQKANQFESSIWVETQERKVNAKSLLGVLSLGIMKDSSINIIANGSDEEEAVNALVSLVESDFVE